MDVIPISGIVDRKAARFGTRRVGLDIDEEFVGTRGQTCRESCVAVCRDEMKVVKLDPPRIVQVVHYGKMLRGPGVLRCTPMGGDRTQVVWHEWFHLPGGTAGKVAWPVLWPGSKVSLTAALKRFAAAGRDVFRSGHRNRLLRALRRDARPHATCTPGGLRAPLPRRPRSPRRACAASRLTLPSRP